MGKTKWKGDEHACRINYLFQAGHLVAKSTPNLSQYYGQVLTVITEKTAPKKDFTMKRSMCKKCHAILKVGENAMYRVRKNKHRKGTPNIVIGCKLCGEKKRLPTTRGYQLKAEREGKIIQNGSTVSPPNGANKDVNVTASIVDVSCSTIPKTEPLSCPVTSAELKPLSEEVSTSTAATSSIATTRREDIMENEPENVTTPSQQVQGSS